MKQNILKIGACMLLMLGAGKFASAQSMPTFSNDQEKEAWVKAHPAEYKKIASKGATTSTGTVVQKAQPSGQAVKVAGFPAYVSTGNKQKDDETYAKAKNAWIAAHPAEYKNLKNKK
jgi:hypothetical protein